MSNNTFAKFTLSILLSLIAISSAANEIKNKSDSFICTQLTELVFTEEAIIKEAKERQLNCSEKYNFTTSKTNSTSEDGLIVDTFNKPFVPECKTGYEKNKDSTLVEK